MLTQCASLAFVLLSNTGEFEREDHNNIRERELVAMTMWKNKILDFETKSSKAKNTKKSCGRIVPESYRAAVLIKTVLVFGVISTLWGHYGCSKADSLQERDLYSEEGTLRVAALLATDNEFEFMAVWDPSPILEQPFPVGEGTQFDQEGFEERCKIQNDCDLGSDRFSAGASVIQTSTTGVLLVAQSSTGAIFKLDSDSGHKLGERVICDGFTGVVDLPQLDRIAGVCPSEGTLVTIDKQTLEELDRLEVCVSPQGLSRDAKGQRLYVNCPESKEVVLVVNLDVGGPPTQFGGMIIGSVAGSHTQFLNLDGLSLWRSERGLLGEGAWSYYPERGLMLRGYEMNPDRESLNNVESKREDAGEDGAEGVDDMGSSEDSGRGEDAEGLDESGMGRDTEVGADITGGVSEVFSGYGLEVVNLYTGALSYIELERIVSDLSDSEPKTRDESEDAGGVGFEDDWRKALEVSLSGAPGRVSVVAEQRLIMVPFPASKTVVVLRSNSGLKTEERLNTEDVNGVIQDVECTEMYSGSMNSPHLAFGFHKESGEIFAVNHDLAVVWRRNLNNY